MIVHDTPPAKTSWLSRLLILALAAGVLPTALIANPDGEEATSTKSSEELPQPPADATQAAEPSEDTTATNPAQSNLPKESKPADPDNDGGETAYTLPPTEKRGESKQAVKSGSWEPGPRAPASKMLPPAQSRQSQIGQPMTTLLAPVKQTRPQALTSPDAYEEISVVKAEYELTRASAQALQKFLKEVQDGFPVFSIGHAAKPTSSGAVYDGGGGFGAGMMGSQPAGPVQLRVLAPAPAQEALRGFLKSMQPERALNRVILPMQSGRQETNVAKTVMLVRADYAMSSSAVKAFAELLEAFEQAGQVTPLTVRTSGTRLSITTRKEHQDAIRKFITFLSENWETSDTSRPNARTLADNARPQPTRATPVSRDVLEFDLKIAQKEVQLAEEKLAHTKQLSADGVVAESKLGEAEVELLKAQRAVKQLEAMIDAPPKFQPDAPQSITSKEGDAADSDSERSRYHGLIESIDKQLSLIGKDRLIEMIDNRGTDDNHVTEADPKKLEEIRLEAGLSLVPLLEKAGELSKKLGIDHPQVKALHKQSVEQRAEQLEALKSLEHHSQTQVSAWNSLGLLFEPLTTEQEKQLQSEFDFAGGLRVAFISPQGPAEAAGIRVGDVLVSVGRLQTASPDDLSRAIGRLFPDVQTVKGLIIRGQEQFTVTLELRNPRESAKVEVKPPSSADLDLQIARHELALAEEKATATKRMIGKGYKTQNDLKAAELDVLKAQRALRQLEAEIKSKEQSDLQLARQEVEVAEETVEFTKKLVNKGYKSKKELEAAELELRKAQRTLEQLESKAEAAKESQATRKQFQSEAEQQAFRDSLKDIIGSVDLSQRHTAAVADLLREIKRQERQVPPESPGRLQSLQSLRRTFELVEADLQARSVLPSNEAEMVRARRELLDELSSLGHNVSEYTEDTDFLKMLVKQLEKLMSSTSERQ